MSDFFETVTATEAPDSKGNAPAALGTPAANTTILALDLGNKCGWALRHRDGRVTYGTEVFTPRANWTPGQRWQRFRTWLSQLVANEQVHELWFERVVFGHSSASSSDVYGGFRALVEMVADSHRLDLQSVAVPTIKKHWTGKGNAKKEAMVAEAKRRGYRVADDQDNTADALAILDYARAQEV